MPNVNRTLSGFIGNGNPDTWYETGTFTPTAGTFIPYAGGDLGTVVDINDRAYQKVYMDSGATASAASGAPAAAELAYWKDRSNYIVTNDSRFALLDGQANSFRNNVAGVIRSAVPAGSFFWILKRGRAIAVKEAGSATGGMTLICSTSASNADALGVAINTAPNCIVLGTVRTATAAGNCVADVDIPTIP